MALLTDFYLKRGDTREPLQVICQDANGNAIDLTGASAKFNMKNGSGSLVVNDSTHCTIVTAASGIVKYQWQTADTATAGDYTAEFQLTFGDGRILTFPNTTNLNVHIIADLGS